MAAAYKAARRKNQALTGDKPSSDTGKCSRKTGLPRSSAFTTPTEPGSQKSASEF